jgi:uncharacterized protein YbaP (TraB family)
LKKNDYLCDILKLSTTNINTKQTKKQIIMVHTNSNRSKTGYSKKYRHYPKNGAIHFKKALLIPMLTFFVHTASAEKTGSLLWRISGNGLEQPSYIFGTHHLYSVNFLDEIAGLKDALASSQQVVGELVMQDMVALGQEMQRAGMMPPDTTWQMLLSEEDYRFVDERLTAVFGAGLQALGMLKPALVNVTYTLMHYQRMFPEANPEQSSDAWFQQQAVNRGIPVIGLETVHDQTAALFGSVSLSYQATDLVCALRNIDYLEYSVRKLNRLYRSADLTGLAEMLREESPCPMRTEQEFALNSIRNERWLEKLPTIMADKPSFIAVGALHLAGEVGIVVGLQRAGFTVEAVK